MCGEWKQSQGDASATARAEGGGEQWMAVAARSGPMEAAAAAPLSLRSSLVALSEKMKRRKEDRLAVVFRKEEKERRS